MSYQWLENAEWTVEALTSRILYDPRSTPALRAAAIDKRNAIYMGYGASWSYSKYIAGEDQESEKLASDGGGIRWRQEKVCRCDSHHLFCWGHEKQCDYHEDGK